MGRSKPVHPAVLVGIDELAVYNAEVSRGIVHTPEWKALMAERQRQFDEWQDAKFVEEHPNHTLIKLADGGVLAVPPDVDASMINTKLFPRKEDS
jgi:hypothetical protein